MIVMYHKFGYELDGVKKQIDSKMVCIGEDPILQWLRQLVTGCNGDFANIERKITTQVQLPIRKEVYLPILKELEEYGVVFKNKRCRIWV
jgi:hypothetical protein